MPTATTASARDELALSTTVFGPESDALAFPEMLERTKRAGFDNVEISRHHHLRRRGLVDAVADAGLSVTSIHGVLGADAAHPDNDRRLRALEDELRRMDELAAFAPCPYVVHYVDRYLDPSYGRRFRESVERLLRRAMAMRFTLAVETAPYKPRHNERYPDSAEIAAFVRSFDSPSVRMTVDINHSNIHENLDDVARNASGLIANVHISDNHGEWEDHLPPGEGVIDLRSAFGALRGNGYAGPCNLEFHLPLPPDAATLARVREKTLHLLGWNG